MAKLVQITDPHIGATDEYRLAGVDTRKTFGLVMDQVAMEEPDLLLLTGDNAADCSDGGLSAFLCQGA